MVTVDVVAGSVVVMDATVVGDSLISPSSSSIWLMIGAVVGLILLVDCGRFFTGFLFSGRMAADAATEEGATTSDGRSIKLPLSISTAITFTLFFVFFCFYFGKHLTTLPNEWKLILKKKTNRQWEEDTTSLG